MKIYIAMSPDKKSNKSQNVMRTPSLKFQILFIVSTVLWVGRSKAVAAFVPTSTGPATPRQTDFNSAGTVKTISVASGLIESRGCLPYGQFYNSNEANKNRRSQRRSTELYSFMGSDGGLLGIGTPELFTIILIGYFVLGPSDLYKLVKEIGKFIQNFQSFAAEATSTLETNMESQLQLEEIRKTQQELNDAFSFRRSINVEEDSDPFAVNVQSPRGEGNSAMSTAESDAQYDLSTTATSGAAVAPKKKKMRRIKRKKTPVVDSPVEDEMPKVPSLDAANINQQLANDIPAELDMDEELRMAEEKAMDAVFNGSNEGMKLEEKDTSTLAAELREERMERLQRGAAQSQNDNSASSIEQSRFQQQLSGDWNGQILANNDKLEPLGEVMNLLAVLEEEKLAADLRLKEEFKARESNEERFYQEKRKLLEEAAAEIQASAYAGNIPMASAPPTANNETGNNII